MPSASWPEIMQARGGTSRLIRWQIAHILGGCGGSFKQQEPLRARHASTDLELRVQFFIDQVCIALRRPQGVAPQLVGTERFILLRAQ